MSNCKKQSIAQRNTEYVTVVKGIKVQAARKEKRRFEITKYQCSISYKYQTRVEMTDSNQQFSLK